jgi:hypothetical protein
MQHNLSVFTKYTANEPFKFVFFLSRIKYKIKLRLISQVLYRDISIFPSTTDKNLDHVKITQIFNKHAIDVLLSHSH